jgi:hypothetical protein
MRLTLLFKSNRGGRCEAASEAAPAPIYVRAPPRKKEQKGKKKMRTTDKYRLFKKNFLSEIVIYTPIDFYLLPRYTISIDRKTSHCLFYHVLN